MRRMDLWRTELRDDGVFVAAYDNPPMNYFTGQATAELRELLARWRDPDVKAVVITGAPAGKYITHYSVEELVQGSAHPEQLRRSFPENIAAWHTLLQNITYLDKAVVAGITGDAGGGGLELSLNCDIRILQRGDFRVGFPECALGILTGTGSQMLTKIIGHGRALDFLLRSRYVDPAGRARTGHRHRAGRRRQGPRHRGRLGVGPPGARRRRRGQALRRPRRQPASRRGPAHRGRGMAEGGHRAQGLGADAELRRHAVRGPSGLDRGARRLAREGHGHRLAPVAVAEPRPCTAPERRPVLVSTDCRDVTTAGRKIGRARTACPVEGRSSQAQRPAGRDQRDRCHRTPRLNATSAGARPSRTASGTHLDRLYLAPGVSSRVEVSWPWPRKR